ncbi:MAG: PAS domain S-box protein [Desulfovibrionaceae bacterium]|nr:PAS domain S-box protein [Desulfovibrionaceae bacterium]
MKQGPGRGGRGGRLWRWGLAVLVGLALASVTASVRAAVSLTPEERQWLDANAGELTLWFDRDYPPIEFQSPDGVFAGVGADIMRLLAARLGVEFRMTPSSDWNRQLQALESGESAIAPVIVRTPERERFAFFSDPYITIPCVIITRRDANGFSSLDALKGRRVSVVRGFVSEDYLREHYGDRLEIVPVASVVQGLRDVSLGVTEAMIENLAVAAYHIDKEKLPNLRVAGSTDLSYPQSFAVSRRYPLLFSAMHKAMRDIPDAEVAHIVQKWIHLEKPGFDAETVILLKYAAWFAVALAASLGGMSWWLRRRLQEKQRELQHSEEELREKGERLNLAFEAANDGLWDWDVATGEAFFSPRYYTMLGYEPGAFPPSYASWRDLLHPEDLGRAEEVVSRSVARSEFFETEFRMRGRDGQWVWILARGRVMAWEASGAARRVCGTHVDISERKQAQERLALSEKNFKAIVNNAQEGILIVQDNLLVFVNPRLEQMAGLPADRLLSRPFVAFIHPDDRETVARRHENRLRGRPEPSVYDFRILHAGGGHVWGMISVVIFEWNGRSAELVMVSDITDRKNAEQALRQAEARYRDIFESAPVAIFRSTPGGRFLVVNPSYAAIAGYESPEAMIQGVTDIANQMYAEPAERDRYKDMLARHGSVRDFEARLRRRDGSEFWASMTSRAVRDDAGSVVSYDGFLVDVTERKQAEEALRQARDTLEIQVAARTLALRQANERLLELDRQRAAFLSSASHELRTPLTSVLGFAKLARRTFLRHFASLAASDGTLGKKAAIIENNLAIIEQEGERLTRLINDLLDLNKIEAGRMEWRDARLDVAQELQAAATAMQGAFAAKPKVRFSLRVAPDAGQVVADRDRLRQVVLNLLSNAVKFTETGFVRLVAEGRPDGGLGIRVEDSGPGVAGEDLDRIFQKFYQGQNMHRESAKTEGTGLGLAICKNIIEHYGGRIRAESHPGRGSVFVVDFPPTIRP